MNTYKHTWINDLLHTYDIRHYINLDIFEKRPHSLKKICTVLKISLFCLLVNESSPHNSKCASIMWIKCNANSSFVIEIRDFATFYRQKKIHSFTHPCLRSTFIFIYTCTFIYLKIVQIKRWSCQCSMTFVLNSKNNIYIVWFKKNFF